MKLQFKHQKFQADAAKAVCDVFAGQPYRAPTYLIDPGVGQIDMEERRTSQALIMRPSPLTMVEYLNIFAPYSGRVALSPLNHLTVNII